MMALAVILATLPWSGILAMGAAIIGLVLVSGLVAGQFRRGVVQELRDSLGTANTELDIERKRGDRLEEAVRSLEARLGGLEVENRVLRETLQTGLRLAPEFGDLVKESFRRHEEESRRLVEEAAKENARHVQEQTEKTRELIRVALADALKAQQSFEERVTQRVRFLVSTLADVAEEPQRTALARALSNMATDDAARIARETSR